MHFYLTLFIFYTAIHQSSKQLSLPFPGGSCIIIIIIIVVRAASLYVQLYAVVYPIGGGSGRGRQVLSVEMAPRQSPPDQLSRPPPPPVLYKQSIKK